MAKKAQFIHTLKPEHRGFPEVFSIPTPPVPLLCGSLEALSAYTGAMASWPKRFRAKQSRQTYPKAEGALTSSTPRLKRCVFSGHRE